MSSGTEPKNTADAKMFLRYLEQLGIQATVAGGFLRDGIWGANARDIDIYIGGKDSGEQWIKAIRDIGFMDYDPMEVDYFQQGDHAYEHQCIQGHREIEASATIKRMFPFLVGRDVDFVLLRWDYNAKMEGNAEETISRFNVGCSQIGISNFGDLAYTTVTTPQFEYDYLNGCGTVIRTGWGFEHTAKNMHKLKAKYDSIFFRTPDGQFIGDIDKFGRGEYDWQQTQSVPVTTL